MKEKLLIIGEVNIMYFIKKFLFLSVILTFVISISNFCFATTIQEEKNKIPEEVRSDFDEINELKKDYIKNYNKLINKANFIIEKYPNDKIVTTLCYHIIGRTYEENNNLIKARKYYENAYKLDSTSSRVNYDFGIFEFKSKNYDKSIYYLTNVINIEDNDKIKSSSEKYIGDCYYNQKNYNEAINHYNSGNNFYKRKSLYYMLGMCFLEMKDYSTAIENFTQAIIMDPNYGYAYRNRGIAYRKIGSEEQARQDLQKAKNLGV